MKRTLITFFFFSFFILNSFSQNTWTQKAFFGGTARYRMTGFSIGSKGYFGLGVDNFYKKDFWEYDPNTNAWTQKANFGGTARSSAVGFGIGTKGYVGTGFDGVVKNDFWEYDQGTNTWTQKASMTGAPRTVAVGFSIGKKGYIGTGSSNIKKNDFWEYNTSTNTWTAKANYGGGPIAGATGFSIGNKGYIGTGQDAGGTLKNDFWEYNPGNNSWLQKANFGGTARNFASAFSIGNKGYIGLGEDGNPKNDFWEYDSLSNVWNLRAAFGGSSRLFAAGFSINNSGYFGSGVDNDSLRSDFWEYAPLSPLLTSPISGSPFCVENIIQVSYTTLNTYSVGNIFFAELSDASGSFANPVNIGAILSTTSGTIQCTIPLNTPAGNAYRIRVSSTNPQNTGIDNGTNLIICSVTWPTSFAPVCYNGNSFPLTGGLPSGGSYSGTGVDALGNFNPSQVSPGTYTLTYTVISSLTGCICSATNTITVLPPPSVSWPVSFAPTCGNSVPFLLNGGLPSGGTYSGPGVDAFGNFDPTQVPFGTTTFTYTYADAFGCTNTATNTINVINCIDCGTCYTPDTNIIANGNFSNGNSGFFSGLSNNCGCAIGSYCVTTDAFLKCSTFFHINDHTSGTGNYMVIDGSQTGNSIVWQEGVTVSGSKTYTFSFWVHPQVSFIAANPVLQIFINNISQGSINTSLLPKQWNNIVFSWTSVSPGVVPVTIRQTNIAFSGTDYGFDDFSFNACIPIVIANGGADREICSGDTVHLDGSNNLLTHNWYQINTGNPANYPFVGTGNIVVSPVVNTCYLLVSCNENCCDTDSVCIIVNPKPVVTWPISYSNVCTNQAPVHLIDGLPAGGIYSGPGVSGNYFDPAFASLGINVLTYTYTNSFGCKDSITNTIRVIHCVECGPCFNSGPDLAVNGDFENGNTGFSSTLSLHQSCTYGSYYIDNTADQKCNLFYNIPDHTTGSGKYMVVDGDVFAPKSIWSENVNVTIGNTYKFSFWMHPALSGGGGRADIDVLINGLVKISIVGQNVPNQWTNFIVSWVANVNGSIPIELFQTNNGAGGYDYGLDDIIFKECIPILEVTWPVIFLDVCPSHQPFLLTGGMPSGGTYSGQGVSGNYFDPSNLTPGNYVLTYTYIDITGCNYFTTNKITVLASPVVTWLMSYPSLCGTEAPFALTGGLPAGGTYSGTGVDVAGVFHPGQVPFGTTILTYSYANSQSCTASANISITISDCSTCGNCFTPGENLVINGDFENANAGFTSDLTDSCFCAFGTYCVTTVAKNKCVSFFNISDHTSGTGNYLVIDGHSSQPNKNIWKQNVTVVSGKTYSFSFWLYAAVSNGPGRPDLSMMINNQTLLSFSAPFFSNQWNKYTVSWVAGQSGSVPLSIMQTNSGSGGYDYGIDDISFYSCIPNAVADAGADIITCPGDSVHLTFSDSSSVNKWYEINNNIPPTLSFIGNDSIAVAPLSTTCYVLISCNGICCDTDTVCIIVNLEDIANWNTPDTIVCNTSSPFFITGALPLGGIYSGASVNGTGQFDPLIAQFGPNIITYTYINSFGCKSTATHIINMITCINCGPCFTPGTDLVLNGDFSAGNTGFTSALPSVCTCQTSSYCVTTDPFIKCNNSLWFHIPDHTSGSGNYMIVDGDDNITNMNIWSENVTVVQGQTYTFSFWLFPLVTDPTYGTPGYPNLDLVINAGTIQSNTGGLPLQWTNYQTSWVSNVSGTVPISIIQTNAGGNGNNYGLDDISFVKCEAIPEATWLPLDSNVCNTSSPFVITGALPPGGIYSGPAVNGNGQFDPALAQLGANVITYSYTNLSGCTSSVTNTINLIYCISCDPCYTPGPELVVNGDFSAGNTGFTSSFVSSCTCLASSYCITSDPFLKCNNNLWLHIPDHTSGNGNFMVIDGDNLIPNMNVWSENVTVVQGKTYTFSFWVYPLISSPFFGFLIYPNLDARINTSIVLSTIGGTPLQWTHHLVTWVATVSGTVPVIIMQTNAGANGNDYGLDDISFKACESVIAVNWVNDLASVCVGGQLLLTGGQPSGGLYSGLGVNGNYFDATGLSPGNYILTYTFNDLNGCSNVAQNMITVISCPVELNLKLFIEGFYLPGGTMNAVIDPVAYPQLCDTVIVELHRPVSPFELLYSIKGVIDIFGNGVFVFPPGVLSQSYYIAVRHRNTIETWSKMPVLFNGTIVNFDFTR